VDPTQWLHVFQVRVLRRLVRQSHVLVATDLRNEYNATDFLDLWVLRWRDTVHVASDLNTQVRDADEALEDVLGEHVRVTYLLEVI